MSNKPQAESAGAVAGKARKRISNPLLKDACAQAFFLSRSEFVRKARSGSTGQVARRSWRSQGLPCPVVSDHPPKHRLIVRRSRDRGRRHAGADGSSAGPGSAVGRVLHPEAGLVRGVVGPAQDVVGDRRRDGQTAGGGWDPQAAGSESKGPVGALGGVGEVGFPAEEIAGLEAEGGRGAGEGVGAEAAVPVEVQCRTADEPGTVASEEGEAGGAEPGASYLEPVEVLPRRDPDLLQGQDLELGRVRGAQDEEEEGVVVPGIWPLTGDVRTLDPEKAVETADDADDA